VRKARSARKRRTAASDGYTLSSPPRPRRRSTSTSYKTLPYDPVKSFAPVSGLSLGAQVVMVKNELR